jgi:hypothetical protein
MDTSSGRNSTPLRGSHPADLLQNVIDFSRIDGVAPAVTAAALRRCDSYFVR